MIIKEKFKKKLLVEGNDDQHVIWALCKELNLSETFDVIDCEGAGNLNKEIQLRFKQPDFSALGIIVDADVEIKNRWNSLKNLLVAQGFSVPDELPNTGLIVKKENMKVGVWIMPNNNLNGMLEDFISFLIPKDDKLLPIIDSTLDDIEKKNLRKYAPIHKSKAVIHSWLAWQEKPGTPMGLSITQKYLSTDDATCSLLIKWLTNLFHE